MSDVEVIYDAAHPKGRAICEICLKFVPWPAYNTHVSECAPWERENEPPHD